MKVKARAARAPRPARPLNGDRPGDTSRPRHRHPATVASTSRCPGPGHAPAAEAENERNRPTRRSRPIAEEVVPGGGPRPTLAELTLAAAPPAWRAAGFDVDDGRHGLDRRRPAAARWGRTRAGESWAGRCATCARTELDGLPTRRHDQPPSPVPGSIPTAPSGSTTWWPSAPTSTAPSPRCAARVWTSAACARVPRRRERSGRRSSGSARRSSRSWSTRPVPRGPRIREAPAGFYGLALATADIDATAGSLGPLLGEVRDAVQPGRRIATVRREAELGLPVAFMTL